MHKVSGAIFKVFGMTRPGIEPRSPRPLANTLPARPMRRYKNISTDKKNVSFMTIFTQNLWIDKDESEPTELVVVSLHYYLFWAFKPQSDIRCRLILTAVATYAWKSFKKTPHTLQLKKHCTSLWLVTIALEKILNLRGYFYTPSTIFSRSCTKWFLSFSFSTTCPEWQKSSQEDKKKTFLKNFWSKPTEFFLREICMNDKNWFRIMVNILLIKIN